MDEVAPARGTDSVAERLFKTDRRDRNLRPREVDRSAHEEVSGSEKVLDEVIPRSRPRHRELAASVAGALGIEDDAKGHPKLPGLRPGLQRARPRPGTA